MDNAERQEIAYQERVLQVERRMRSVPCPWCHGTGKKMVNTNSFSRKKRCPICVGVGKVERLSEGNYVSLKPAPRSRNRKVKSKIEEAYKLITLKQRSLVKEVDCQIRGSSSKK